MSNNSSGDNERACSEAGVDQLARVLSQCEPQIHDMTRVRVGAAIARANSNTDSAKDISSEASKAQSGRSGGLVATAVVVGIAAAAGLMLWQRADDQLKTAAVSIAADPKEVADTAELGSRYTAIAIVDAGVAEVTQRKLQLPNGASIHMNGETEVRVQSAGNDSVLSFDDGSVDVDSLASSGRTELVIGAVSLVANHAIFAASVDKGLLQIDVHMGVVYVLPGAETPSELLRAPASRLYNTVPAPDFIARSDLASPLTPSADIKSRAKHAGETQAKRPAIAAGTAVRPSADEIYRNAEAIIASGDVASGRTLLETILRDHPSDPRVDTARYDLASLARRVGDLRRAQHLLEEVLANQNTSAIVESAHYSLCQIYLARKSAKTSACIRQFRASYANSSHDAELLDSLAKLVQRSQGCVAARPLLEDLIARHAKSTFALRAKSALEACADGVAASRD